MTTTVEEPVPLWRPSPLLGAAAPLLVEKIALLHPINVGVLPGLLAAVLLALGRSEPGALAGVVARRPFHQLETRGRASVRVAEDPDGKSGDGHDDRGLHGGGGYETHQSEEVEAKIGEDKPVVSER